jgi:hypothetical protein
MSPLKLLNKNKEGIRYVDYFFERMKYAGNGRGISKGVTLMYPIDRPGPNETMEQYDARREAGFRAEEEAEKARAKK